MKMEIDYAGLSIYLLGQPKGIFNSEETDLEKLSRGVFSIEKEEYFANILIENCLIPKVLLKDEEIFSKIEKKLIHPVKERVIKDLEKVKGELIKLKALIKERKLSEYIAIKKKNGEFRFYDSFLENPSEKILNRIEEGVVNESLENLAGYIGRSNGRRVPYFKGETLKEALERGIMTQEFMDKNRVY